MGCGGSTARTPARTPAKKATSTPADCKAIASEHEAALKELFDKIDSDSDGTLQVEEFKGVVEECTGDIDLAKFMAFYDTNGAANGTLDLAEFGWYMADTAWNIGGGSVEGANSKMPGLIEWFTEELETIQEAAATPTEEAAGAPLEAAPDVPQEAATDAPEEAATDAPEEAATVAPEEAATDSPEEAGTDAPEEAATDASAEAPTDAPVEAASDTPVEAPAP